MNEYYPMNTSLPEGMEYDEKGNIFWYYEDADRHMCFRLEKERLCYKFLPLSNREGKLPGFFSSPYGKAVFGLEFPDDELYRGFYDVKWIKEKRKKNLIIINSGGALANIFVTSAQYDFVLNYLKVRCPDAKIK